MTSLPWKVGKKPMWQNRGWKRYGSEFHGVYRHKKGKSAGLIKKTGRGFEVYILKPPRAMKRHRKWECFHYIGNKTYIIDFKRSITNVNEAILNVERLLSEAIR